MNTWLQFIKQFYASERKRDSGKCRYSGTLKRVSKIYNCKKRMANRSTRKSDKFSQLNPMFKSKSKK
jgi:hypothetical protein